MQAKHSKQRKKLKRNKSEAKREAKNYNSSKSLKVSLLVFPYNLSPKASQTPPSSPLGIIIPLSPLPPQQGVVNSIDKREHISDFRAYRSNKFGELWWGGGFMGVTDWQKMRRYKLFADFLPMKISWISWMKYCVVYYLSLRGFSLLLPLRFQLIKYFQRAKNSWMCSFLYILLYK